MGWEDCVVCRPERVWAGLLLRVGLPATLDMLDSECSVDHKAD